MFCIKGVHLDLTISDLVAKGDKEGQEIIKKAIGIIESLDRCRNALKGDESDGFINRNRYLQSPGYVYVCQEVGRPVYKIGKSNSPIRRLGELNRSATKNPFERQMVRIYESDAMDWAEKYFQKRILPTCEICKKLQGEWWECDTENDLSEYLDHFASYLFGNENKEIKRFDLKPLVGAWYRVELWDDLEEKLDIVPEWNPIKIFDFLAEVDAIVNVMKSTTQDLARHRAQLTLERKLADKDANTEPATVAATVATSVPRTDGRIDYAAMDSALLKGHHGPGSSGEKLRRAYAAISNYNAGKEPADSYRMSAANLRKVSGVRHNSVVAWMSERESEINDYNALNGLTSAQHDRGNLAIETVVSLVDRCRAATVASPVAVSVIDLSSDICKLEDAALKGKRPGYAAERIRRSVAAIQNYNTGRDLSDQIEINVGSLRTLAAASPEAVGKWVKAHAEKLAAYTAAQGHPGGNSKHNRGKNIAQLVPLAWNQ